MVEFDKVDEYESADGADGANDHETVEAEDAEFEIDVVTDGQKDVLFRVAKVAATEFESEDTETMLNSHEADKVVFLKTGFVEVVLAADYEERFEEVAGDVRARSSADDEDELLDWA